MEALSKELLYDFDKKVEELIKIIDEKERPTTKIKRNKEKSQVKDLIIKYLDDEWKKVYMYYDANTMYSKIDSYQGVILMDTKKEIKDLLSDSLYNPIFSKNDWKSIIDDPKNATTFPDILKIFNDAKLKKRAKNQLWETCRSHASIESDRTKLLDDLVTTHGIEIAFKKIDEASKIKRKHRRNTKRNNRQRLYF